MWCNSLIFFLILCLHNSIQLQQRRYNLEYYSVTCNKLSKALKLLECEYMKVATSSYLFSVRTMFGKNVGTNFSLRFIIDVTPMSKNRTMRFTDFKFKGCDDLLLNYEIPMIKHLTQEIRRSGNFPYQCPFKEDLLYEIRNLSYTDKFLAPSLPFVKFAATIELYDAKNIIGSLVFKGGIVPKMKTKLVI